MSKALKTFPGEEKQSYGKLELEGSGQLELEGLIQLVYDTS